MKQTPTAEHPGHVQLPARRFGMAFSAALFAASCGPLPDQPVQKAEQPQLPRASRDVNADTFRDVVRASDTRPVLVEFEADWCGPCRAMEPDVEAVARRRKDVDVVKVDIDVNGELADRYGVRGVPTGVVLDEGEIMGRFSGRQTAAELEQFIDNSIQQGRESRERTK